MHGHSYIRRSSLLAAAAAVMCALLTGCITDSFSETRSEGAVSKKAETSYSTDDVSEAMAASLSEYDNRTAFDTRVEQDVIDTAVRKLQHYHPDLFWLNGYTTTTGSGATIVEFMPLNDYTSDELSTMHSALISAADSVVSQIPAGSSEYDKALFVHDYIVSSTHYAKEKRGLSYNGLWGTAYGCLVEGSAVCQGYAEAYSLIMQKAGIECGVCTGQSDRGSHAWNYVKIDGSYYWVDVTWDDPEAEDDVPSATLSHSYFMINDEMLLRTRSFGENQFYVPSCTSLDRNYYMMNSAYLSFYSPADVGRILAEHADEGVAEMMFADEAGFREAVNTLFEEQKIWELSDYTELPYTLNYAYDDKMYILQITY